MFRTKKALVSAVSPNFYRVLTFVFDFFLFFTLLFIIAYFLDFATCFLFFYFDFFATVLPIFLVFFQFALYEYFVDI